MSIFEYHISGTVSLLCVHVYRRTLAEGRVECIFCRKMLLRSAYCPNSIRRAISQYSASAIVNSFCLRSFHSISRLTHVLFLPVVRLSLLHPPPPSHPYPMDINSLVSKTHSFPSPSSPLSKPSFSLKIAKRSLFRFPIILHVFRCSISAILSQLLIRLNVPSTFTTIGPR